MFKRDNEQEDRYSEVQQPTHKMRGGINQYGQTYKYDEVHGQRDDFDAASARVRQFQQQQERMRQMQNSTKSQYQKPVPSPLSSIPEVYPNSSVVTTSSTHLIPSREPVTSSTKVTTSKSYDNAISHSYTYSCNSGIIRYFIFYSYVPVTEKRN